ncbi:cytochrome P450 [Rickenella mellea]|uniref:Cytochrome P450 n=1 Tax=Rickenella mellea TaxID=50990 RepID=A0A4Y7Q9Y4_9AGAM|nr:cytochrome P450 [Rickenella mellea]
MSRNIAQTSFVLLCSYILWRLLRNFLVRSTLSNIPGPPKGSWWKGNFAQLYNNTCWPFHSEILQKYGTLIKTYGFFGDEYLYVSDPRALHHILVKDQVIFAKSRTFLLQAVVCFGEGLLGTEGIKLRIQRKLLNPVFSMRHMRGLLPVLTPVAHQMRDVLKRKVEKGEEDIDVQSCVSRAALEYIGQGGLGYSFDALDESKTNNYSDSLKMVTTFILPLLTYRQMLPYLMWIPRIVRRKFMEWSPFPGFQRIRKVVDTIHMASIQVYMNKKEGLARGDDAIVQQIGKGKDIISILMRANMATDDKTRLPESEVIAQMNTFTIAAHDTATSATCRVFHQLALDPKAQARLRQEILQAYKDNGNEDLDYDTLMSLPYLDGIVRETLRVFPPIPFNLRITNKNVVLPLLWPIKGKDGNEISEVFVKKGTTVVVGIQAANRNKAIWGEDAEIWKPERWLSPLPQSVADAHLPGIYASMMTFLAGGRSCIGFKFAEMEIKLSVSTVLSTFEIAPSPTEEIEWHMRLAQVPTIKGSSDPAPHLPLKVSLVKQ